MNHDNIGAFLDDRSSILYISSQKHGTLLLLNGFHLLTNLLYHSLSGLEKQR